MEQSHATRLRKLLWSAFLQGVKMDIATLCNDTVSGLCATRYCSGPRADIALTLDTGEFQWFFNQIARCQSAKYGAKLNRNLPWHLWIMQILYYGLPHIKLGKATMHAWLKLRDWLPESNVLSAEHSFESLLWFSSSSVLRFPRSVVPEIQHCVGCNASYVEELSNIIKLPSESQKNKHGTMVINTEWPNFISHTLQVLPEDRQLDNESLKPGDQPFEKLTGALYLGDVARRVLLRYGLMSLLLKFCNGSSI